MNNTTGRALLAVLLLASAALAGMSEQPDDKTLSPYFFVQSDDATTDRMPLLSTTADVNIAGVIADVRVTQVYKNDGKRPIEAIYVFPASTRAAVYAMKMTIGDRVIIADVREREQARRDYEQARDQGKTASLLEQERPNVFSMNVANIMPGDFIRVELCYTELLVPEDGSYEFVYPTVVGPRYNNRTKAESSGNDKWIASPFSRAGAAPTYTFGMNVELAAGMPVQEVSCPSHQTRTDWRGLDRATVRLDASEKHGGNRDFVLRYRLAGGKVESGLLLYQGAVKLKPGLLTRAEKGENFFLLMVQPPQRVTKSLIPAREYIFIVDVSGSMYGFPLEVSKTLLRNLISNLRPTDYFNVLLFAGGNTVMAEQSLAATDGNIARALRVIDNQQGGGGTELLPALRRALALPRTKGTSRTVVAVTDGYVSVEVEAFDLIRQSLGEANFFAFGIGSSVNRFIIEGMARAGMGEPFVIEKPDAAAAQAEKFRRYIQTPVLTGVKVDFSGLDAYDVEPLTVPDVMAERPIIVFGKYRGRAQGTITVRGTSGAGAYRRVVRVAESQPDEGNAALRYLWARHRIQRLADYNNLVEDSGRIREVTRLGLDYNLLTAYTSFVAIDQNVRNREGKPVTVEQPLPMPEGVSDYAVGGALAAGSSGRGFAGAKKGDQAPVACCEKSVDRDEERELGAAAAVVITRLAVTGGVGEARVRPALEAALPQLEQAYRASSASGRPGRLVVEFSVGADGKPYNVRVKKNGLTSDFGRAAAAVIKGLAFGLGQKTVTVTLELQFTP
jgi:Ca-activated chloride channel family protein